MNGILRLFGLPSLPIDPDYCGNGEYCGDLPIFPSIYVIVLLVIMCSILSVMLINSITRYIKKKKAKNSLEKNDRKTLKKKKGIEDVGFWTLLVSVLLLAFCLSNTYSDSPLPRNLLLIVLFHLDTFLLIAPTLLYVFKKKKLATVFLAILSVAMILFALLGLFDSPILTNNW